jgi:long-chain acyl-CoA synthetase
MKKKIFDAGLAAKREGLKRGHLKHALYDRLIFNKIKKGLGLDQVRLMVSGSAPLSDTVMTFYRCMLGVFVVEGYGQTEGAGCTTVGTPDDMITVGHVGGPAGACEVVLFDVPEMGYLHTDTNNRGQACVGRGEICFRGPNVFKGYYKDEEKTRETIDDEGWLHSGDIGLWRLDGSLQIIDRKKNIFKLSQGEYVAPEKIENIVSPSPLIAQCFVYGDSFQSALVAIIVPDEDPVRNWAASFDESLANAPFETICKSEKLKKAIMSDIRRLSKENKLNGFETVKAIHLDSFPFSVDNELLTPTFKLKRQKARDRYETEIAKLYAGLPPPMSKL